MSKAEVDKLEPEYPYTNRLVASIKKQELVFGESTAGDWLAMLGQAELTELNRLVEKFDTQPGDKTADIVNLLIHLVMLEIDDTRIEVKPTDLVDYLESLSVLCHLEVLSRQGLLQVSGDKRLVGNQDNDTLKLVLTVAGRRAAQSANADPLLKEVLKAGGNPLWN